MQTSTFIYIILSILFSFSVAFFQYFYKEKRKPKINIFLFILRGLSLFLLCLLFINPKISNTLTTYVKPTLSVLIDNSYSIKHFNEQNNIDKLLKEIKNNKELNNKFDINTFSFAKNIKVLDSLSYQSSQTDISKALKSIDDIEKLNNGAIVLLSDGNQTIGDDYEYIKTSKPVYPIVLGDTTRHKDVKISLLNVNKYSYLNNNFPVEAMLLYDGNEPVKTQFSIYKDGKVIFSKKVAFSKEKNSVTVTTNLSADTKGMQYYTANIGKIKGEKNIKNNRKSFSVEVLSEQQKVLILHSVLHPDLGALKKSIEKNKQRKAEISSVYKFNKKLSDYQLVIFYQPNYSFKRYFDLRKSNYWLITGSKTDWNFINNQQKFIQKRVISSSENYLGVYNSSFLTFIQKDIQFDNFPPLQDRFGTVTMQKKGQILLYQKLKGFTTTEPMLVFFEETDNKVAFLLGENIWKWRSSSFLQKNSFEEFDEFVANIVQYLSSNEKKNRLDFKVKPNYEANSPITISGLYLDNNYQFDNRASIQITIINSDTKERRVIPFSLINNAYFVNIENLTSGRYSYTISVAGQKIKKSGRFRISNFNAEEQFTRADNKKLLKLATKTNGNIFYPNKINELIDLLNKDEKYFTIQKKTEKKENLLNWKWILFIFVCLLTLEWFLRKYHGKI